MSDDRITRRRWLAASPLAAAVLAAQEHAHRAARSAQPPPLSVLDAASARDIEALIAQIIPADETPGAREAGVIHFIDHALGTFDRDKRPLYTEGLQELQAKRVSLFPGSQSIATLHPEQQIRLLQAVENTDFFELLRTHAVLGFFCDPSYGGNRNQIGWKLIGFEDRSQFEPPFGYYDAELKR
jgi:gluconate 2-dehydrogenase gamma chain